MKREKRNERLHNDLRMVIFALKGRYLETSQKENGVNFINARWDRVFVPDLNFWENKEVQKDITDFYKHFK